MFSMIKKALAARAEKAMYEQLPMDLGRFKRIAGYLEPKKLKRIAIAVVYAAVQYLAHEQADGVLVNVAPDSFKRFRRRDVMKSPELAPAVLDCLSLDDVEGQEESH